MTLRYLTEQLNSIKIGPDSTTKISIHVSQNIYNLTDIKIHKNQLKLIGSKSKCDKQLNLVELQDKLSSIRKELGQSKFNSIDPVIIYTSEESQVVTRLSYLKSKRVIDLY